MIFGYVGDFGSGKTLNLVFDMMRNMIYFNRHVFSNIPIEFIHEGRIYRADYIAEGKAFRREIFKQRNTDIVVDEAGIYFPNFMWNKIPEQVLMQFHEQRKTGCNFFFTTQVQKHTVKRMRDLSNVIAKCKCHHILPINFGFFWKKKWVKIEAPKLYICNYFTPNYFEGSTESEKRYHRYFRGTRILYPSDSKRVFEAYKTNFLVEKSAMMRRNYDPEEKEDIKEESKIIIATH